MVAFYEKLKTGQPKDTALRQAMLSVKKETSHASPFFWAAFEMIGDTAPLGR